MHTCTRTSAALAAIIGPLALPGAAHAGGDVASPPAGGEARVGEVEQRSTSTA
jgi:hypothetical protein